MSRATAILLFYSTALAPWLAPAAVTNYVKMTPLTTFVSGTNATLAAANAYTDAHTGAGLTTNVVRDIAGRVTSNVVTKAYVEGLGISGGGIDTNAVNAIIASSNLVTKAVTNALASQVSGLASSKRDLTNNVCAATTFGAPFGLWSRDNLPSGVTWNAQPVYDESIDLWCWAYNGGSAQSEEGGVDATSLTFGYGSGFTSTRTATAISLSNDTFVTHAFVTNAIPADTSATVSALVTTTATHTEQIASHASKLSQLSQFDIDMTNTYIRADCAAFSSEVATVADAEIAAADTSYAMTNRLVALNQSAQYVVADGATLTILPPATGAGVRDWIVYANATAETPLDLSNLAHILCADAAYTNAVSSNVVTMIYFSEITNNTFVIGRQELTPVK